MNKSLKANPCIWALSYILFSITLRADRKVHLVIEIARHGARKEMGNPELFGDPDPTFDFGDLTPTGMRQHYNLGRQLYKTYRELFVKDSNFPRVEILASNVNRTIVSAQSQILGIMDLGSGPRFNTTAGPYSQPPIKGFNFKYLFGDGALPYYLKLIGIQNSSPENNSMFQPAGASICPLLHNKVKSNFQDMVTQYSQFFLPLYAALNAEGFKPSKENDLKSALKVCDIIISNSWSDEDFPPVSKNLMDQCLSAGAFRHTKEFMTAEVHSTYVTPLNRKLIDILNDFRSGKNSERSFVMMLGHDGNIGSMILNFFPNNADCILNRYQQGVYASDSNTPSKYYDSESNCIDRVKFTANFVIELYTKDNDSNFFIAVKYSNKELNIINGRQGDVTFDEFIDLLNLKIDKNFSDNCSSGGPEKYTDPIGWLVMVTSSLIIFILLVFCWLKANSTKKKSSDSDYHQYIDV
jgi:hypothetical protein